MLTYSGCVCWVLFRTWIMLFICTGCCINFWFNLVSDLSLKDFPLPNITEFLNIELPKTNERPSPITPTAEVLLPRNQWYYQYEKRSDADGVEDVVDGAANRVPRSHAAQREMKVSASDVISWVSFIAILCVIDLVWFLHRMARTYTTAKLILYGSTTISSGNILWNINIFCLW